MPSLGELAAGAAVELLFIVIALAVLYRLYGWFFPVPKRLIVPTFQRGVVLSGENVQKVLGPGAYWITPQRRLLLCDMRPTPFQVAGQEMLTSDGMAVRISLGGEYRINDPALFVTQSSDAFGALYLEVRQALRAATGELSSELFLSGQAQLVPRMKELIIPKASHLGVEITSIEIYEAIPVGWLRQL